jgi:hypothetical protein
MDSRLANAISAIALAVIALFVILAYFNGWG